MTLHDAVFGLTRIVKVISLAMGEMTLKRHIQVLDPSFGGDPS